jgi:hypothetical protein
MLMFTVLKEIHSNPDIPSLYFVTAIRGGISTVVGNRNTLYVVLWLLSEGGAISGFECIFPLVGNKEQKAVCVLYIIMLSEYGYK